MYFESRSQAGAILADQVLEKYRYENCAVVAIGEGGVLIGEQIAVKLHCVLMMLLSEGIEIPGESLSIGAMSQSGQFTYNSQFSDGEINEYTSEFHGYLEEKKREAHQKMNRLLGDGGIIDKDMTVDEMHILDVKENFMGLNHYYEDNILPSKEETIAKINQVILNWK